ncbi:hypothetical protein LCGC14_1140550 [marine sediment metagenome]|uniref:Uncharacterized protein n=1 Tax=marine sediment metagenome TaxID=412755 RepID=A0A0F9PGJ3_9ZZZZ
MPVAFDKCVADKGRVRTITLKGGRFMPICYPKGGGAGIAGEVKHSKKK